MSVSSAFAAGPAWRVSSESAPTNLPPGGTGKIIVHVANASTSTSDGSTVTVIDTLPEGVIAIEAGEVADEEGHIGNGFWDCTGTTVVRCTNNPVGLPTIAPGNGLKNGQEVGNANPPGQGPEIGIDVSVSRAGAGENEVRVSGGGAAGAAEDTQPVTLSSADPPFGLASTHAAVLNADGTPDTQAGSHPYAVTVGLNFNNIAAADHSSIFPAGGDTKDIAVEVPQGIVGDPQATPQCTHEEFDGVLNRDVAPTCAASSQVGVATVSLGNFGPAPISTTLPVYNLVPPPGVPAEFGFSSFGIYGLLDASLRPGGDYGLKINVDNTAQRSLIDTSVTLWGVPAESSHDAQRQCLAADHESAIFGCSTTAPLRPFLSNPTQCGPSETWTANVDTWLNPVIEPPFPASFATEDNLGQNTGVDGCERLAFSPTITVQPESTVADSPTGLSVDLHVPQTYEEPNQLATANLKDAVVKLPAGYSVSPSAADGLQACSPEEIGLHSPLAPACPDASKIGSVEVDTPLLAQPLEGSVYIAAQNNNPFGSLLAIYVTAEGAGALIKLAGHVETDPLTGQLTTTFAENPELPFSDFKLTFFGGPRAALATPASCGSFATESSLTPYSGAAPVDFAEALTVNSGCGGGFAPAFSAGTTTLGAGAFTSFTTTASRQDGEQTLNRIAVVTPPGIAALLARVPLCSDAQASAGTCGAASQIGTTTVAAGPGSDPFWLGGRVYLTGPIAPQGPTLPAEGSNPSPGAPFGLSIVVPAVAGPFNFGNVVVRARINVDPTDAHVTITSDPLPQMVNSVEGLQSGIPARLRTVSVTIDRPGFIFNPTNCNPQRVAAAITGGQGATASVASPFGVGGCKGLPFTPKLSASTQGKASRKGGASLDVKVVSKGGPGVSGEEANIKSVKVDLPKQLPSRLTTLQKACTEAQFNTNPAGCPKESNVGMATASTPVLANPLIGPAYLVSHGGAAFPDLVIVLQGEGVVLDLTGGTDIKKGVTSSTFRTVPDAPISSFELKLPTGKFSVLGANVPAKANYNLCGQTLAMPTVITGQNGTVVKPSTKVAVSGCSKKVVKKKAAKKKQQRAKG